MEQPEGFTDGTRCICELIKMLYRLKQSGHERNIQLNQKLASNGFKNLYSDPYVYIQRGPDGTQIITIWVNDLLVFTIAIESMKNLKHEISEMFKVSDLSEPNKIVGIEISCDREKKSITMTQVTYIDAILRKYRIEDINSVATPMDSNLKLEPRESEVKDRSVRHEQIGVIHSKSHFVTLECC
jgi:Reverse transcriptase (RNA-dependent DNA polymerase)